MDLTHNTGHTTIGTLIYRLNPSQHHKKLKVDELQKPWEIVSHFGFINLLPVRKGLTNNDSIASHEISIVPNSKHKLSLSSKLSVSDYARGT